MLILWESGYRGPSICTLGLNEVALIDNYMYTIAQIFQNSGILPYHVRDMISYVMFAYESSNISVSQSCK